MRFAFCILATVSMTFVTSSSLVKHTSSLNQPFTGSTEPSVELVEDDQLFDQYETITHLMSSLHGRIGINDDAMITYGLGRKEPHDIDPKELKLVSANDVKKYDDKEWVVINGDAVTVHCGSVDVTTTGEDWALMQHCPNEEVAIRRLMATFNEEGHQFIVSTAVLQTASKIHGGTYRCIKSSCPLGPLALSIPTASAMGLERAVAASQIGSYFLNVTATPAAIVSKRTILVSQIDSQFPKPTTFSTATTNRMPEDPLSKSQDENEFNIKAPTEEPAEEIVEEISEEQLPLGRWLSKRRSHDPYITEARPQCLPPHASFTLSGKVKTFYRNPRKTSYTTISGLGFTTISTVPHDPNRPPPKPSVVTPNWATASFFQTFSCREIWMDYFNMDPLLQEGYC
ncbi:hypothetical protein DID88_005845 [Monilinia fructigena]|uniref:Ig-like domain-containing protein n=1 Tax=Monilinia fructigena TaxID=38457 RepID=A0A395J397_9HELO|nr:hypothetical protein DID88_005845 [Monilinia fructigena]